MLFKLADQLSRFSGKKVYGYLKPEMKAIVDAIVAELSQDDRISKLYDLWYEQREAVIRTYTDALPERIPLEQNKGIQIHSQRGHPGGVEAVPGAGGRPGM